MQITEDSPIGPATQGLTERLPRAQPPLSAPPSFFALPTGSRLGEFEILGLIGQGGFGIVYRAFDLSLQREVAIKEYLPAALAMRDPGGDRVSPRSVGHASTFDAGLRSFVNEARLLARFDHPALVKVHRFWEANGTAYMAMPYYTGPTLRSHLKDQGPGAQEADILDWLLPLMEALEVLHAAQCYHRDIAPDNILLTPTGPLLLDFGAARRVIGDMTQALTVVLKPGYAPIEQYGGGEGLSSSQGPWTDVYALACVVRFAITGQTPMASVDRMLGDGLRRLEDFGVGLYRSGFLQAIDAGMALRPQDRLQNIDGFRRMLLDDRAPDSMVDVDLMFELPPPLAPAMAAASTSPTATVRPVPAARKRTLAFGVAAGAIGAAALLAWAMVAWQATEVIPTPARPLDASMAPPAPVLPAPLAAADVASAAAASVAWKTPRMAPDPPHSHPAPAASTTLAVRTAKASVKPAAQPLPTATATVEPATAMERAVETSHRESSGDASQCSELLLRASLGSASAEDAAAIKHHCH